MLKTKYAIIDPEQKDVAALTWLDHEFRSDQPSYTEMVAIIGPLFPDATWERVAVNWTDGAADMFVDALGGPKLFNNKPGKNLPINDLATRIYWTATRMYHIDGRDKQDRSYKDLHDLALIEAGDLLKLEATNDPRIHGRAVLFAGRIWF